MEIVMCAVVALFYAASIYLMLSRHMIRILLGVSIFGNAVNLTIFTAGRLTEAAPPVLSALTDAEPANPLPQALILTAIVISFSIFAFLLVLGMRAYQTLGTDDVHRMRTAEANSPMPPPMGY